MYLVLFLQPFLHLTVFRHTSYIHPKVDHDNLNKILVLDHYVILTLHQLITITFFIVHLPVYEIYVSTFGQS